MRLRRLRSRIILSFCLLMLCVGAATMLFVSGNVNRSLTMLTERQGTALAHILAGQAAEPLSYSDLLETKRLFVHAQSANSDVVYVFVTGPEGDVLTHTFTGGGFPVDLLQVASSERIAILETESGQVRDTPAKIVNGTLGSIHVGVSMASVEQATFDTMRNIASATILALLFGVAIILVLANLISRPLYRLMDATRRLGEGELGVVAPVIGEDELAGLATTFNRMAEQIRERIAETQGLQEYLERILDHVGPGILVISSMQVVEYANRTIREEYGNIVGLSCEGVFGHERPCAECPVGAALSTGTVLHRRHLSETGRSYELTYVPFFGRNGHTAVVETVVDVTSQRALTERLQKAERLAVAGEIAAGVVHTINNPLDGMRRAIGIAERSPGDHERLESMLSIIKQGTDRIASVTQSLLNFARVNHTPLKTKVNMNTAVEEVLCLVRLKAADNRIRMTLDLAPDSLTMEADPQAINEVVMNLVMNAIDATPLEGEVRITTRRVGGSFIELVVSNTGLGVPPELRERIFEPFVSTKTAGKGTGLGLSVVRRIVDVYNGEVAAESEPGEGATFRVRFPTEQPAAIGARLT